MKCPNCKNMMQIVSLYLKNNQKLEIDQCMTCGGLWFDKFEYIKTQNHHARQLDSININKFKTNTAIINNLYCPYDNTLLIRFHDPNFPKNIDIERCSKCGGFFFNHGELSQYHQWKENKQNNKIDLETENQIKKYLAQDSKVKLYSEIENLGNFLSTPYYFYDKKEQVNNVNLANNIIQIILYILRLFILK